jgi:hypothetical protein
MKPMTVLGNIVVALLAAFLAPASYAWDGNAGTRPSLTGAAETQLVAAVGPVHFAEDEDRGSADDEDDDDEPDNSNLPPNLQDRGTGVATSMYGTYVREGEWTVFPSYEYLRDHDLDYDPAELGFPGASSDQFFGEYRAQEAELLIAYGLDDDLVLELEVGGLKSSLKKAPDDDSNMPDELSASGLGDVRVRLDWRLMTESGRRPELFTYADVQVPHDTSKPLVTTSAEIGTSDWVVHAGVGAIRGYSWGTMTYRAGVLYDFRSNSQIDWGEVAVEYLKRVSPTISVYAGLIIDQGDEGSLVGELQWHLSPNVILKLNSGVAVMSHGIDWEPEIGVLFLIP